MDHSKVFAGHPRLEEAVILAQTDTTVGFLSQNAHKLSTIKKRSSKKPFLKNVFDLKTLKNMTRVPSKRKKELRRAKKTTFVIKNQAFRVARPLADSIYFRKMQWCYSTSANESGKKFDPTFAKEKSDIIILNEEGLKENPASVIIQINNKKRKRLR